MEIKVILYNLVVVLARSVFGVKPSVPPGRPVLLGPQVPRVTNGTFGPSGSPRPSAPSGRPINLGPQVFPGSHAPLRPPGRPRLPVSPRRSVSAVTVRNRHRPPTPFGPPVSLGSTVYPEHLVPLRARPEAVTLTGPQMSPKFPSPLGLPGPPQPSVTLGRPSPLESQTPSAPGSQVTPGPPGPAESEDILMEDDPYRALQWELTPSTYYSLVNETEDFKMYDVEKDMEQKVSFMTRRQIWKDLGDLFTGQDIKRHKYEVEQACFIVSNTYRSALVDLRRYFRIRDIYYDTLEYQVGYLTHQIVHKYQNVLELFQIMVRRYEQRSWMNRAPAAYMLYIYTNIVQFTTVIFHLCNMMHEIEAKYKYTFNHWDDLDKELGIMDDDMKYEGFDAKQSSVVAEYLKQREKLRQQRLKELRRQRKKAMKDQGFRDWHPPEHWKHRRPRQYWPVKYGWSIESVAHG